MAMFNTVIESQKGTFKVRLSQPFTEEMRNKTVLVTMSGRNKVIDRYRSRINVSAVDKNSSVLNLTLTDAIKIKAEDILNELVKQYNIDAIKDKNIVSEKTKDFIEDRLQSIGANLGVIQDNVKNYKIKFGITGLSEEGILALQSASVNNQKIVQLESELSLAEWIYKKLQKETETNEVLPTNLGFQDANIVTSIVNYNELVLDKNRLLVTAGDRNPQLIGVQSRISTLNQNLLSSLDNLKKSLEIQLSQLNIEAKNSNSKISDIPLIERGLIDIERQNIIYSELYSYLLKKEGRNCDFFGGDRAQCKNN